MTAITTSTKMIAVITVVQRTATAISVITRTTTYY